jgi:3-oxoacyl-(acyl-carrier-protein) synthase
MTPLVALPAHAGLPAAAAAAGLTVIAAARWPEPTDSGEVAPLAGFVVSTFNPLFAAVADRCLNRRPDGPRVAPDSRVTAVIVVSTLGDVTSAAHVAEAVDAGDRVRPLLFFQSVPNAIAGYVASRRRLTGPMASVGTAEAALAVATLLIDDADADEALIVSVDVAATAAESDRAAAILVTAGDHQSATGDGVGSQGGRS